MPDDIQNVMNGSVPVDDSSLENVCGGAGAKLSICPKCKKKAMRIKFKRLECQNCGYVESFFK